MSPTESVVRRARFARTVKDRVLFIRSDDAFVACMAKYFLAIFAM